MKRLKFKAIKKEGYYEYHLPLKPYRQFNVHTHPGYAADPDGSGIISWYYKLGLPLYNLLDHDSVMISLFLLDFFDNRQPASLINLGNPDRIRETFTGSDPMKVQWKFGFEFIDFRNEIEFFDFGIISPAEFLIKANYSDKDLSNRYYYLTRLNRGNYLAFSKLFNSDVTSWWFLFVHPSMQQELEELLAGPDRPSSTDILELVYAAVGIQIGTDEGYGDYLVIQSVFDLEEETTPLMKSLQLKGTLFENSIRDLFPIQEDWQGELYEQAFRAFLAPEDEDDIAARAEAIRAIIQKELEDQPVLINGMKVQKNLVKPVREVWTGSDGEKRHDVLWLVFEEGGGNEGYAVFYDEETKQFGHGFRTKDGELGIYAYVGTFMDALKTL